MNYTRIALAGFVATAAMTIVMFLIPLLGLPKLTVSTLFMFIAGGHPILGWLIHFVIGIVFAFVYVKLFNNFLPVVSDVGRGAIYSIIMFVFSAFVMMLISFAGRTDMDLKEVLSLSLFGNVIGYIVYGSVLGVFIKRSEPVSFPEQRHSYE